MLWYIVHLHWLNGYSCHCKYPHYLFWWVFHGCLMGIVIPTYGVADNQDLPDSWGLWYPLVNCHITMDNHHFIAGKINYFDWAIFNSFLYVCQRVTHNWLVVWNIFFHILGIIIPTDFHIFQRGRSTTNQIRNPFWTTKYREMHLGPLGPGYHPVDHVSIETYIAYIPIVWKCGINYGLW